MTKKNKLKVNPIITFVTTGIICLGYVPPILLVYCLVSIQTMEALSRFLQDIFDIDRLETFVVLYGVFPIVGYFFILGWMTLMRYLAYKYLEYTKKKILQKYRQLQ